MEPKIGITSIITTSIFALTFILVGVPLWWKTTEVYRYPVPHEECQQLLTQTIKHSIHVKLILVDREVQQGVFWEDVLYYSNEINKESSVPAIIFHWSMSTVTDEEQELIKQFPNISALDAAFNSYDESLRVEGTHYKSHEELKILVLPQSFMQKPKFTIGSGRQGYVLNNADSKVLAQDVILLARKMAQVERLQKLYTSPSSYSGEKTPDKDRMRYLRSSTNFDITFSLIVPEPHVVEVHWDIENAVNAYLNHVLKELSPIFAVNVKSQVLYMTSLPMPKNIYQNDNEEFVVNSDYLPSLINPVEARLGSDTSVHPNLNFVVYIPSGEQTPLRIHDSKGNTVPSNAFLLPQWGGFLIYNCPVPENSSLPHKVNLNSEAFMEVFMSQFYLLLGLPDPNDFHDERIQVLPSSRFRSWEIDFLYRKNAQEYLSSAISSLSSLSQLLQTIGNIVIRDDVGQKIYFALSSTKQSLKLLAEGYLEAGFSKAQSAFVSSDEAFFDPSLLALLYFPEDQKYAIYIPLFLPISIPVVTSIGHIWKFWRDKRKLKPD